MESLVELGLVRNIGVSNCPCALLANLLANCKIPPCINQIELNPYLTQAESVRFHKEVGVGLTAYSPFGNPGYHKDESLFHEQVLIDIAAKIGATVPQVILRWNLQRGVIVIPKTLNKDRLKENLDAQKIELSQDDMDAISALNKNLRKCDPI